MYSLGGVLHMAATCKRYPGDPALLSARSDLPTGFADLLVTLLAEVPADRPPDAASVLRQLDHVRHASNITALIEVGESDRMEFKSSLHHPHGSLPEELQRKVHAGQLGEAQAWKDVRRGLNLSVTKTLAAFLNSSGGTLLIGIDHSGAVLGIEADYRYLQRGKQDKDGWLLSLRNVVNKALGEEVWSVINVSLVPHEQSVIAVIECPPRASETWHTEGASHVFYIRASSATHSLHGPKLTRYVREHWPA